MSSPFDIGLVPGDGTGPEVLREGRKCVSAAAKKYGFNINFIDYDLGGDRFLATGDLLPDSVLSEFRDLDAIYLGAIGHPEVRPGILEKGILLSMRFELDLYINLRPVTLYPGVATPLAHKKPEDVDFVVVRENTEGLYAGAGGILKKGTPQEVATQESINTRFGVERCLRYAFEYTRDRRERKKLTLCGKTNVLTYAFDLWERAFNQLAGEYPEVETDYAHVDATCMWMVKNPEWFDVIVTDNMFGDIITDLGAMIQGGMGIAAGGNIHPGKVSMFEPIGGSAPKYTGQNVINPLAAIAAGQMMLAELGENEAAKGIESAIKKTLAEDIQDLGAGKMGHSTSVVGDLVVKYLLDQNLTD